MPEGSANQIMVTRIFFFLHWAMGFILLVIKKTPLRNKKNSPITDPITKMGVAHAFEL